MTHDQRDMTGGHHPAGAARRRSSRRPARSPRSPRGVILLEILLALSLFVLAAAVIGSAMTSCMAATARIRRQGQAMDLAQTVLAELATGQVEMANTSPTQFIQETEEGERVIAEGWTYEIELEELTDMADLKCVSVIVRDDQTHQPTVCRLTQWMFAPADELEGEEFAP